MVRRLVFAGGTSCKRDGLYPEMLAEPDPAANDPTGSTWHQAYQRVAPDPGRWPVRLLGGGVIGDLPGLPASRLAVLPGTSHVGLLDRVDWLQSMILEFLGTPVPRPL